MLANDQVEVGVVGHAVALVGGALDLGDAVFPIPAAAHVARHVREQEIMVERMPDRPLGECEPGPDLIDLRLEVDQVDEFRLQRLVAHCWRFLHRLWQIGRGRPAGERFGHDHIRLS